MPLIGKVRKLLAKGVLIILELTAAADAAIYHKNLIVSKKGMDDIMKIVKSLKESWFLLKDVSKPIKRKQENKEEGF